jgi:hypothetical protein
MNAIAGHWIGGCRRELLDRTFIWNQAHLRRILRQYETHHNQHRPHRSLDSAAPLKPLPEPVQLEQHRVRRHPRAVAWSTNTAWSHDTDEVLGTYRFSRKVHRRRKHQECDRVIGVRTCDVDVEFAEFADRSWLVKCKGALNMPSGGRPTLPCIPLRG